MGVSCCEIVWPLLSLGFVFGGENCWLGNYRYFVCWNGKDECFSLRKI